MAKIHALLAAEQPVLAAVEKLLGETEVKFSKADQYFNAHVKTLAITKEDFPGKASAEEAAKDIKELPTTVVETLSYVMDYWGRAEDLLYQKNASNQKATGDLFFRGQVLVKDLPVDELMGLEARFTKLRSLFSHMPTLDATKAWDLDPQAAKQGTYKACNVEVTAKTEKIIFPIEMSPATEHHPAQIQASSRDEVVGTFQVQRFSGSATSRQKADILAVLDELILEAKQARSRANDIDTVTDKIADKIIKVILQPLVG